MRQTQIAHLDPDVLQQYENFAEKYGDLEAITDIEELREICRMAIIDAALCATEMTSRNMASAHALHVVWLATVRGEDPKYPEWEYPAQASREIVAAYRVMKRKAEAKEQQNED